MTTISSGFIKRLIVGRGFGFIRTDDDGDDLFFSHAALRVGLVFDADLRVGQQVTFRRALDGKGRPCARDVRLRSNRSNA